MKGVYQWSCHVAKLGAAGTGGKPVQTSFWKKPTNRSVKCCLCELQLSSAVSFWPDVMKYHPNPFCNLAQILNQSSSRLCWKIRGKTIARRLGCCQQPRSRKRYGNRGCGCVAQTGHRCGQFRQPGRGGILGQNRIYQRTQGRSDYQSCDGR